MTTQAFWDEKAEKAEQRRQERAEQAEQVQQEQPVLELQTVDFEDEATQEDFIDDLAETDSLDSPEPSAIGEGVEEVPMSMAAKTADTATVNPGFKIDKRKWTPKTVPHDQPLKADDADGRNPTRRKDVVEPITQTPDSPDNKGELKEIGEQVTEHQDVEKKWDGLSTSDQGGSFGGGDRSAVSSLLDPDRVREAMAKFKR
jgi:hypothetical protein